MRKIIIAVYIFTLLVASTFIFRRTPEASAPSRSNLEIKWYDNDAEGYSALKNDQIDFFHWALTTSQIADAQTDPNIQLAAYTENGIYEFDINNNYTMKQYPNVRSPTNALEVRKAIAHLINKTYITEQLLDKNTHQRIDVPISNSINEWWNTSVTDTNYPYPYNPDEAAALLASLGFNDTDSNGYLNYPSDWPGIENLPNTDTTSMPIWIYVRKDQADRNAVGNYLAYQLRGDAATPADSPLAKANWPSGFKGGDFDVYIPYRPVPPWIAEICHIYTGGWSLSKFPAHYMYYLFHSMLFYRYGPNYVTGMNETNQPNYPDLDEELEKAYYATDISTAIYHSKNAQSLLIEKHCVSIWLWNYRYFNAYRKELAAVINHETSGLENVYTYINAYRTNNPTAPIRIGVPMVPSQLNVLYSAWMYEWAFLHAIYPMLLSEMPYSIDVDQPWVAQDWEIGTWDDGGETKIMATFWIRKDVGCVEPITGNLVDYFTADDLEFSIWYNYAFSDSWTYYNVYDVNHIRIVNNYQVEVYFDRDVIWSFYDVGILPLIGPRNILLDKLCEIVSATFTAPPINDEIQFGGSEAIDSVIKIINATADGTPITEGEDFYIRGGLDVFAHNVFVNKAVPEGATITVYYYKAKANGADGFYLGSNLGYDWTDTMYSYGMFYPVSINPTAGGNAQLQRNQHFFLETPPLGEMDWRWYWQGTTKPRSGNYMFSILDIVMATTAYSTRGDGTYDPRFFNGADVDANDLCHIGICDIVTIVSRYATTFGKPPD